MPRVLTGSQSQSYFQQCSDPFESRRPSSPVLSYQQAGGIVNAAGQPLSARRVNLKGSTSFTIPRLPTAPLEAHTVLGVESFPTPSKRTSLFRASERGRGELLPTCSASNNVKPSPNRLRSLSTELSSSTTSLVSRWNAKQPARATESPVLRSRAKRTPSSEDASSITGGGSVHDNNLVIRHSTPDWGYSGSHDKPPLPQWEPANQQRCSVFKVVPTKNSNFFQMLAVLIVTCLVWESYHRAVTTTEQFEKLKHDESMLMLHLQGIERKSIQLHELIGRLSDGTVLQPPKEQPSGSQKEADPVDSKLIHVQTQQLYQMEEELQHELRGLQTKLQQVARSSIVNAFGEGPIQLTFDLEFDETVGAIEHISIQLWYDTPHAAWSLIEQVLKGAWTGAKFTLDDGASLTMVPPKLDPNVKLDFIEKAREKHEAWTVGLTQYDNGGIGLFVNLQDNSVDRKHDVCVGKVIEGFGSLQKLVSSLRSNRSVTVKSAAASRLPRGKASGIFE